MNAAESSKSPPALDWGDPAAVNAWALDVYTQARDAIGAGLDATAPKRRRVLSRAEARRAIREADSALRKAFAFAGVVLPDATLPAPDVPREATEDEPGDARIMDDAWRDIIDARRGDEPPADRPIAAVLLAAITGGPYEGAEMDPPAVAVLRTVRATVDGWANARSKRAMFAAVPFVDLDLLTRRLDAAIAIVKRSPGGVR